MPTKLFSESNEIWKRVGLHELRKELQNVVASAERFELALRELPSCDKCAKLALLEHIQNTGRKLGTQVASLSVLAESLKSTVEITENIKTQLTENIPQSCKCQGKKCSCHHNN